MLRSGATIRTPEGKIEGVTVVGIDDATLIGLPRRMKLGERQALSAPDSVFIDESGARKLFGESVSIIGTRLELNDRRAVIAGIVDATPTFTSGVILYTKYSNALSTGSIVLAFSRQVVAYRSAAAALPLNRRKETPCKPLKTRKNQRPVHY